MMRAHQRPPRRVHLVLSVLTSSSTIHEVTTNGGERASWRYRGGGGRSSPPRQQTSRRDAAVGRFCPSSSPFGQAVSAAAGAAGTSSSGWHAVGGAARASRVAHGRSRALRAAAAAHRRRTARLTDCAPICPPLDLFALRGVVVARADLGGGGGDDATTTTAAPTTTIAATTPRDATTTTATTTTRPRLSRARRWQRRAAPVGLANRRVSHWRRAEGARAGGRAARRDQGPIGRAPAEEKEEEGGARRSGARIRVDAKRASRRRHRLDPRRREIGKRSRRVPCRPADGDDDFPTGDPTARGRPTTRPWSKHENKTKQNKTKQNKTKQNKTKQNKTKTGALARAHEGQHHVRDRDDARALRPRALRRRRRRRRRRPHAPLRRALERRERVP